MTEWQVFWETMKLLFWNLEGFLLVVLVAFNVWVFWDFYTQYGIGW